MPPAAGKGNLIPAVVGLTPIGGYPGAIQCIEGSVLCLEPIIKLPARLRIKGLIGKFIADLPSNHIGIVAEAPRQLFCDVCAKSQILWVRIVELPAATVLRAAPFRVDPQSFRMCQGQPHGRSVGWRSDDNRDVMFLREPDRAFEPIEVVVSLRRFHGAPGKFADADYAEMCVLHELQVRVPTRLRPLLGIPCGAEQKG